MHEYTCDRCARRLQEPIYILTVVYNTKTGEKRDQHFHWECLKRYTQEA